MANSATIKSSTSPESSPVGLLDFIVIMVNSATIKPLTTSPESSPVGLLEEFCIPTTTAEKPASEEMTGIARSGKRIESMKTMLNISANSTSVEAETRDEENHDTMRGRACDKDKEHPKREMRDDGAEPLKLNIVKDAAASAVESIKGYIDWWGGCREIRVRIAVPSNTKVLFIARRAQTPVVAPTTTRNSDEAVPPPTGKSSERMTGTMET